MGDTLWIIGMYALFVIVGAVFLSWLGAIIMAVVFPVLLIGLMMS
jgi:hypothetical protein